MKLADMHVHSRFSVDSDAKLDDICRKSVEMGLQAVCISDHVDCHPNDIGYGYYRPDEYFERIKQLKEIYEGELKVLAGIEFSEPHLYQDYLNELKTYPYDVILGSIHMVDEYFIGDPRATRRLTPKEAEAEYFREVLELVRFGEFDVLAHMDFPKRYFGGLTVDKGVLREIVSVMVNNGIGLEINTSSLRRGMNEPMPMITLVEEFISAGGLCITLGSDAHAVDDIAADFSDVFDSLGKEAKSKVGWFENRRFVRGE